MNTDDIKKRISETNERITDCGRRAAQADDRARKLNARAEQYQQAEGVFEQWNQSAAGVNDDVRRYVTGGERHRFDLEDEEQANGFKQAQNLLLDQYDQLTQQAHKERMDAEDARDEQANLQRVRNEYNEYQEALRKGAGSWA